jgi:hypothetical protein
MKYFVLLALCAFQVTSHDSSLARADDGIPSEKDVIATFQKNISLIQFTAIDENTCRTGMTALLKTRQNGMLQSPGWLPNSGWRTNDETLGFAMGVLQDACDAKILVDAATDMGSKSFAFAFCRKIDRQQNHFEVLKNGVMHDGTAPGEFEQLDRIVDSYARARCKDFR